MEKKLCCLLAPSIVCLECTLSMCDTCAIGSEYMHESGKGYTGPRYHERFNQCPNGANLFTIDDSNAYLYWKKGSSKAPVYDKNSHPWRSE